MSEQTPAPLSRTFITIWAGQLLSQMGSALTSFAMAVYLFERTGQATPLAIASLLFALPGVILAPLSGVVADRVNRRAVMIVGDLLAGLGTLGVALFYFGGWLEVWHIYVFAFVVGASSSFQETAYVASIPMLVGKDQVPRATGMVQTAQGLGTLFAPFIAGLLYAFIGLGGVMSIDFASFLFAVGALIIVRIPQPVERERAEGEARPSMLDDIREGWRFIGARIGLLSLLIYFALVNFMANLAAVMSAPMVLSFTSAPALGTIQSVGGIGMVVGSVALSAWGGPQKRMNGVLGFITVMGLGLLLIGLRPSPFLIGLGFFLMMGAVPMASGSASGIWAAKVPAQMQGRAFSVRRMISVSMMPIAFALAGPLADRVMEPLARAGMPLAPIATLLGGPAPGRGIAIVFVVGGLLLIALTGLAYSFAPIRDLESQLPDVTPEEVPVVA